jgi:hypothetical protein
VQQQKQFNTRAFVALTIGLGGLGLPITGLPLHILGHGPASVARHAWMSAHNALGLLFVGFSIWHVWLNRRPLWSYLRDRAAQAASVRREAVVALVVVGFALLIAGHAFIVE